MIRCSDCGKSLERKAGGKGRGPTIYHDLRGNPQCKDCYPKKRKHKEANTNEPPLK